MSEPVVEPVVEEPVVVEPVVEDPVVVTIEDQNEAIYIPVTNTVTYNVTSYKVEESVMVILNTKAIINVLFFTDNSITFRRTVELTGADYDAWTNDDNYIYAYIKTNVDAIFYSQPVM